MYLPTKANLALGFLLLMSAVTAGAPGGVTITGRVVDSSGRPIPGASIMVYHAGVLNGYSTFCPSCYRDCGKRVKTEASGSYTISKLQSGLWFDLLFVRDGYAPQIVRVKDASAGSAPLSTLKARPSVADPSHTVKGHVVDVDGHAVEDSVVTPVGVEDRSGSMVGTIPGLDPLAVTDQHGNFELDYEKSARRMLVTVESRSLAPRFATLVTGSQRQVIKLAEGATVRGRLVQDGRPVANAEIGLIGQNRGGFGPALEIEGDPFPELRVGTQEDGTFAISDVPVGVKWLVYAKMESVATRGAAEPKAVVTNRPREIVDVGQISLCPGYRLDGRVVLSDGKNIPDGMRVFLTSQRAWDSQTALLDKDGHFEFVGVSLGEYSISPAVRGYSLPDKQYQLHTSIQRNVEDFTITLRPEPSTK